MKTKTLLLLLAITSLCNCLHFELMPYEPKCFFEELFEGSVATIKYKIWTDDKDLDERQSMLILILAQSILNSIKINVSNDKFEIMQQEQAKFLQHQFNYLSKSNDYIRVCTEYHGSSLMQNKKIFLKLKILSDNMDEPDIRKAMTSKDLDFIKDNMRRAVVKATALVKSQDNELVKEVRTGNSFQKSVNSFYKMTWLQIAIVFGMFIYQMFSFRKYFNSEL